MKIRDEEKMLLWVIVSIALCALLWLVSLAATARPMTPEACRGIAQDMAVIAEMRDDGKDQQSVVELVERVLRPHMGENDSYVQFETDIAFMVGMVAVIYDSKYTPAQVEQSAYASCSKYGYGISYYTQDIEQLNQRKLGT